MAKHEVKCAVCNEIFDLNLEQGVRFNSRRYAHLSCYPKGELVPMIKPKPKVVSKTKPKDNIQKKKDLDDVEGRKYVIDIADKYIGRENCNFALITQQIKRFKKELKFTYIGMGKTLIYFYGIKKGNPEKGNGGIGICEYCYEDAKTYFKNVKDVQIKNKNFLENNQMDKEENITIKKPVREIKKNRIFNFLEED